MHRRNYARNRDCACAANVFMRKRSANVVAATDAFCAKGSGSGTDAGQLAVIT